MVDAFSDSYCGVKDYYTNVCLFCKKFGFSPDIDPGTGLIC